MVKSSNEIQIFCFLLQIQFTIEYYWPKTVKICKIRQDMTVMSHCSKELIRKENINHSKNIEMKDIIKEKVIMPYTDWQYLVHAGDKCVWSVFLSTIKQYQYYIFSWSIKIWVPIFMHPKVAINLKNNLYFSLNHYPKLKNWFTLAATSYTHNTKWSNSGCLKVPSHNSKLCGRHLVNISAIYTWNYLKKLHVNILIYQLPITKLMNLTKKILYF